MECPICMEVMNEPYITQCCNQELHKECYNQSIELNSLCPFCRAQVNKTHFYFFDIIFGITCISVLLYISLSL